MHRMMNIAIARLQRAFAHVSINFARARLVLISFVDKNSWIPEIFAIIKFPMCEKVYYLLTYLRKVDQNHTQWYAIIKTLLTSRSMKKWFLKNLIIAIYQCVWTSAEVGFSVFGFIEKKIIMVTWYFIYFDHSKRDAVDLYEFFRIWSHIIIKMYRSTTVFYSISFTKTPPSRLEKTSSILF